MHAYCKTCDSFVHPTKHQAVHSDEPAPAEPSSTVNLGPKEDSQVAQLAWFPLVLTKAQTALIQGQETLKLQEYLDPQSTQLIRERIKKLVQDRCYCVFYPDAQCICKWDFYKQLETLLNNEFSFSTV